MIDDLTSHERAKNNEHYQHGNMNDILPNTTTTAITSTTTAHSSVKIGTVTSSVTRNNDVAYTFQGGIFYSYSSNLQMKTYTYVITY